MWLHTYAWPQQRNQYRPNELGMKDGMVYTDVSIHKNIYQKHMNVGQIKIIKNIHQSFQSLSSPYLNQLDFAWNKYYHKDIKISCFFNYWFKMIM